MKKIIFALSVLAICAACSKGNGYQKTADESLQEISVSVSSFDGMYDTKSAVVIDSLGMPKRPVGNFIWTAGDRIGIYPLLSGTEQSSQQITFQINEGEDASSARFTGTGWGLLTNNSTSYFAYYPYDASVTQGKAVISFTDNLNQVANKSAAHLGVNDYLYAPAIKPNNEETATFNFYHIAALVEFQITVPDSIANRKIKKLEVSSATPVFMIQGQYNPSTTVARDPGASIYGPGVTNKILSDRIKLKFNDLNGILPENKKIYAYFLVGPADVAGMALKVEVWDEKMYSYVATVNPVTDINSQEYKIYRCSVNQNTETAVDLSKNSSSETATANCYIVQKEGRYKFLANIKGNGVDPYDDTPEVYENAAINLDGCTPVVLWESQNDIIPFYKGCLIDNETITLDGDYIVFDATNQLGNAAIALEKDGNIVWTWHIWMPGILGNYSIVYDGVKFFDREIGSISTGGAKDRGLFYQWGKPWPYLPYYQDYKKRCISTNNSIWSFHGVTTKNTFEYTIQHPTEYCYSMTGHTWWCWDEPASKKYWQSSQKTMYDPCPIGWKIANRAALAKLKNLSMKGNYYAYTDDDGNVVSIVGSGSIGDYRYGYDDTPRNTGQGWLWYTDDVRGSYFTISSSKTIQRQLVQNIGACIRPIQE